jgi:hypothetical protein
VLLAQARAHPKMWSSRTRSRSTDPPVEAPGRTKAGAVARAGLGRVPARPRTGSIDVVAARQP